MSYSDLELTIHSTDAGYTADLRLELPARRADLANEAPIALDPAALQGLLSLPDAYGAALTAMMFTPALREAWQRALGYHEGDGDALQFRLCLDDVDYLHAIRWELLRDPLTQRPLAHDQTVRFSRFLSSSSLRDARPAEKPDLRALVVVAGADDPRLPPIDGAGEVERAVAALDGIDVTTLAGPQATLAAIGTALGRETHILHLVCHGDIVDGEPLLYLAGAAPISGQAFVDILAQLAHRPLLVTLAVCESGGSEEAVLSAVGPQLARQGIPAVIGMHGTVPQSLVTELLPLLYAQCREHGQIDRALAAARAALGNEQPWWLPVLWLSMRDGRLWHDPAEPAENTPPAVPLTAWTASVRFTAGNPFTPGVIAPPDHFIGRSREVAMISDSLRTMQSLSLVGEARIGKTSLLTFLRERLPQLLAPDGRYRPIYLSMNEIPNPAEFRTELLRALLPAMPPGAGDEQTLRRIERQVERSEAVPKQTTEAVIEWAATAGLRIVLLLDEFKDMTKYPQEFDSFFCGWLRSLYTHRKLAMIMATRQPLEEIAQLRLYFLNGLGGMCRLDRLSHAEAEQLLRQPHDRPFTDAEVRLGLAAAERHPYCLQVAGDRLYRWKGQASSPIHAEDGSLREAADRVLRREVVEQFERVQKLSSESPAKKRNGWLERIGKLATTIGEQSDRAGNRLTGAFIVLAVLVLAAISLALLLGIIDLETFGGLLRLLTGGNG